MLDRIARGKAGDAALVSRSSVLSYEALNDRMARLARWLSERDVAPGTRVIGWLPKIELAALLPLACARAQLVYVPANPQLKEAQIAHILRDSGARLLIANDARLRLLTDVPGDVGLWSDTTVTEALAAVTSGCLGEPMAHEPTARDPDDLVQILYTSGSTGMPKGVMLSHANLTLGAQSVARYLKLAPDDRTLCALPLSFDYGQNQLFATWAAGGTAVLLDYLLPGDVVKACAKHRITTLAAVPPLWVQLTERDWPDAATGPMRRLTNSGGALTTRLVERLRAIFGPDTDIVAMYGLTEAFRSTFLDPARIDAHPTSMGSAIPFAEVMVVRDDGSPADVDEVGELVHAGPLVAQGYWNAAAKTKARFRAAPAHSTYGGTAVWSGDKVRRGADGLLQFVGRDDALIKSSGNRISPTEIEEAALAAGGVAEAVALGLPDETLGHRIALLVRFGDGGGDPDKLAAGLKRALPNFMQPHHIVALQDFPKNANGKIDRAALMKDPPL